MSARKITSYGDLLTSLLPQGRKLLIHLLTCNDCRQEIVPDLLSEQLSGLVPDPEEWSVPQEPQADEAAEPAAALAELLGHLPEERAALLAEKRFQNLSLLELLLRSSRDGQLDNPDVSEHLASLARQLSGFIPETAEEERQAAYLTRAAVLEANARRLAGNLKEADRPFAHSLFHVAPPAEQAFFQRALALIRWEQGRFDEADSLLTQASRNFVGARLLTEEGATLILLGLFEAERGLFPLAAFHLLGGLAAVDGRERPWLLVRGGLAMALSMASPLQATLPKAAEPLRELLVRHGHYAQPLPFA